MLLAHSSGVLKISDFGGHDVQEIFPLSLQVPRVQSKAESRPRSGYPISSLVGTSPGAYD